jgi:eukaryotic-like serine/threonine-protein kinase
MTERDIFLSALDVPSADRSAFLARACGPDDDLRHRVRALLTAHDRAGAFLEDRRPAADATGTLPPAEFPPAAHPPGADRAGSVVAGRYKLLERIGEGGMGAVWMADQTHPVKRRVAVKLIKEGMDTARVLARFDAERQALALMNHPHIAKVLDAGTTDAGRPFFVMELVAGVPITTFCDTHRLSVADRLAVVQQVCQAVQHAHQKGVLHRDLKPGNILVESHDGRPVPKVIDFGLAKALGGGALTEHTLFTGFGAIVGTPLYMAPEQAEFNAVDVDTRADVYALGGL